MKRIPSFCFLVFLLSLSNSTSAEEEIESWYESKGGDYLVLDSIHGNLYGLLGSSKAGKTSVYFQWKEKACDGKDETIHSHEPMKVNDKLVRFSTYCTEGWQFIYASSDEGRNYLISEFKKSNFVELKSHNDRYKFLFSAKFFTKYFNKLELLKEAI